MQGDARFLLDPAEAEGWLAADLRLNGSSDAADWTSLEQRDLDGSALDLGVFGGPLGDWRDVDNDRDGYDNLEGDCDDFDPAIVPEGVGGSCPTAEGCRGCANGAGGGTALAALLALALTRRQDRRAQPSTPSPDRSSGGTGRGCEAWPLESARRRGARPGRRET